MSSSMVPVPEASHGELPFACDLVMKGGITSGVVYPAAIVELSRDHRFHNIGGASAGAIAAVAAAAAEYGRQTGGGGFDALATIPQELADVDRRSGQTMLQRLFVPQPETKEYFDLFWEQRAMKDARAITRLRGVLPSVLRHSPKVPKSAAAQAVSFGLPVGAAVWFAVAPAAGTIGVLALAGLVGGATYLGSRSVTGALNMAKDAQQQVADNLHGLCNGATVGDQIGLTDWLHDRIEALAGTVRPDPDGGPSSRPLTYGDLEQNEIGLVTLTTNVSQNSSESFPFADETWAFHPDVVAKLFPDAVSSYLVERGRRATEQSSKRAQLEQQGLLKLPPAEELPVVMGARISLSFPVVLSAVPLWKLVPVERDGDWVTEYQEVWLSDGGICSNMPVHLFDSPLPSRPTYGINLGSGATETLDDPSGDDSPMALAHRNVWRPIRTGSGMSTPIAEINKTTEFLGEVLTTMQNWSDNSMTKALGVRDRICTIRLGEGEGGMNLDMSADKITGLGPRGSAAGENLGWMVRGDIPEHVDTGVDDDEAVTQWTRHRWTRLRSAALGVGRYATDVKEGRTKPAVPQGGPRGNTLSYEEVAKQAASLDYLPYRSDWTDDAGRELNEAVGSLTAIDFATANTKSPPPARRLTLSTRPEPETQLAE